MFVCIQYEYICMRVCLCVHMCALKRLVDYTLQKLPIVVYKTLTCNDVDLFDGCGRSVELVNIYLNQDTKRHCSDMKNMHFAT